MPRWATGSWRRQPDKREPGEFAGDSAKAMLGSLVGCDSRQADQEVFRTPVPRNRALQADMVTLEALIVGTTILVLIFGSRAVSSRWQQARVRRAVRVSK
ncbi:hypothetical protein ADT71_06945 [Novosphingobium sp. ST904]|nr:hypothetical protein ADT71_06945 [Novosphingobium sp. ST904]